jgi:aminoglycoside phosphotransferase (APT) family kinase protein
MNIENLKKYLGDTFQISTENIEKTFEIKQFGGGFSNLTFGVKAGGKNMVLRMPPVGASHIHKGHDMTREFNILKTLFPIYPKVPQVYALCENTSVLDAPFYLMQQLEGVVLRAGSVFNLSKEERQLLDKNLIENFALLHQIDFENTPLKDLGKTEGYTQRQVNSVVQRYEKVKTDDVPHIEEVFEWLSKNIPETKRNAFLHNDYKYDNLVLNTQNLTEIVGVLDWELSTIGDAWADLGVMLSYVTEKNDFESIKSFGITITEGTFTRQEFLEKYQETTQTEVKNIVFYYALGIIRLAIIAQQIYFRYKQGFTKDERFKYLIFAVKDCVKTALNVINKGKLAP